MDLFSSFERRGEPLASHWLFARRLVINVGLALALIGVSLLAGMVGYHYLEGAGWVDAFDQAAMIIGGMGPRLMHHFHLPDEEKPRGSASKPRRKT